MNSKELFSFLESKMPDVEYLLFNWSGGGDNWNGFRFEYGMNASGKIEELPVEFSEELQSNMLDAIMFEELELTVNCNGEGYSEGVLLIALKPLANIPNDDRLPTFLYDEPGFKGFAINGKNYEDLIRSIDI